MSDGIAKEQRIIFSISVPESVFERMEKLRKVQPYKVSRSAFVVSFINEGLGEREKIHKS